MPRYEFTGTATVTVFAYVDADNEEEAFMLLQDDPGLWECDTVDGDVQDIECMGSDEDV